MRQYQAYYAAGRAHTRRQIDRLAELVAEGWTIKAAGREIGVCESRAGALWAQIRAELDVPARD